MSHSQLKHFQISSRPINLSVVVVSDRPSGKKTCNLSCVNTTHSKLILFPFETGEFPAESLLHIWAAEGLPPSGISSYRGTLH